MRLGRHIDSLQRYGNHYLVSAGEERYLAENVVVATGAYRTPRIPDFAGLLDPSVTQLHSSAYRNPKQIPEGDVLVVGAGNTGVEISLELAATHRTYLSGRDTGNVPGGVRGSRLPGHVLVGWFVGWWVLSHLTADTGLGRKGREFGRTRGTPLVRFGPGDLAGAGVVRLPRAEGARDGKPQLADGQVLEVATVVWATGYKPDFGWIGMPVFGGDGCPAQRRGVAEDVPGLCFLGLPFQHKFFSETIKGVGADARRVAAHLAGRTARRRHETDAASEQVRRGDATRPG